MPLWNPVLLAEQVGTLAAIHRGPFIVQCALGAGRQQFEAMGASTKTRPSAFEEGLDIVRCLLAGETVTSEGRYDVKGATIAPIAPEPVDFWVGGSVEPSIDRAARVGDGWLAGPELTPEQAKSWSAFYQERCTAHGREPKAIAIRRDVYVGESDAEAASVAEPIVSAGYRGFDPSACTYGSIETVAKAFRDYAAMGYTDIIIRHLTDDHEKALASMRRLSEVRAAVFDA
jgi:alkanesulfonate monooxygenase SsuD/methylene tetrahydromethanopterin reductase-like flavin-dependent oxidoreductase (luciferase family)